MWLIIPLVYIMSWKSYRRFGQAFSETAAWVFGYLAATGILLALHYGGVSMITATPDDPAAVVCVIGGFVGMGISRYLWKRRGGHLEPVNNPLANNRYFRAARAMIFSGKKSAKTRKQAPATRPAASTTRPRQTATTSNTAAKASTASRPAAQRTSTKSNKTSAQKWGRVVGAMMTPHDSQRRPPR